MIENKFYLFDTVCLMGKCPNCGSKINEFNSLDHSNPANKNYKCLDCGWSIIIDEEFKSAALLGMKKFYDGLLGIDEENNEINQNPPSSGTNDLPSNSKNKTILQRLETEVKRLSLDISELKRNPLKAMISHSIIRDKTERIAQIQKKIKHIRAKGSKK